MKKIISISLISSLIFMTLTVPVMALPLELIKTSQRMHAGDLSSLSDFLETVSPLLSPEAQAYASEVKAELETRETSGMEEFLEYAGKVFLLISIVMIIGGIQMVLTLSDVGEGLISIILGVMFLIYAVMMLGEAEPEPAL